MRTSKKTLAVLLTTMCVGTFGTVNCSAEEVTINFWHHYSEQSAENETLTNVLIPEFEKENPDIKVNAVSHEWGDLHDKILISAKSETLPDVARLDSAWVPEFQKMGILVPLNQEISDFSETADSLLESAMSTAKIGDDYFGLALNTNTKIMFYNKKAFEDAGVEVPQTMEEFVEAAKKLAGTNENGQQVWGYEEPALSGWNLCPFIWSMGGAITNEEQTQATGYLNSPETVAAIQMLADLYSENVITGWNSGDIPMTDGFGTGRYAMIVDGPWKISELEGAYPDFEYGTAAFPAGEAGSYSVLGGEDISMFNTADKEAAWKFMQFMTGEFAQEEMAKCSQIPVNKNTLESDTVKNADFAPFIEAIRTAKSRPTVASWSEIDSELATAVSAVMNGEKTAQDAMDELAEKVDALLAE
ncbi:MAG: extracellular solute-binding protein [Lachnospiraceae bacterium]|nr:extracellular solute-binding protein [Lachnospiraceae bacterium]MCI5530094.1 extracellular solute-binding protein [Blautia sp.]MDD7728126.1 extracellular solute-binding protein [Clostridia bacterium]MDY5663005.1 extracellular solute-binding protein [Blautia sp.]